MKKLILTISFAIISMFANAQVSKWIATHAHSQEKLENGKWSNWSDWQEVEFLIVLDSEELTFTMYTDELTQFDLIQEVKVNLESDDAKRFAMLGVDDENEKCVIQLITKKNGQQYILLQDIELNIMLKVQPRDTLTKK